MRQTQKEKLLPEQTAEKIRGYIEGNGLKVGDKLPNEFQLAEICGVGRSTVREAIKLLVFSGKVEVIRGSGTYIKKEKAPQEVTMANDDPLGFLENSEENLFQTCLEFVDVRLMLEPEVAAMAATNADYADCQKLQMLQREVGQLVDQGKDHIAADIEYHKQLAACTHNQTLCNLMEIVVKGIPLFVKISNSRQCAIRPSKICTLETPFSIASIQLFNFGSMPPPINPSPISSLASDTRSSEISVSLSFGSL